MTKNTPRIIQSDQTDRQTEINTRTDSGRKRPRGKDRSRQRKSGYSKGTVEKRDIKEKIL